MQQMFYSGVPLLESVGLWEPAVCELRDQVSAALRQAFGPLRAYAAEYEQYLELHNSDLESLLWYAPPEDAPRAHLLCTISLAYILLNHYNQ